MKTIFRHHPLWIWGCLLAIAIFITRGCSQFLEWDNSGNLIAHHFSVWGDWAAHFTFISYFKNGSFASLFGDNPLFAGAPLQYPFLSHVLSIFFEKIGTFFGVWSSTDLIQPIFALSLILIFSLPFVLFFAFRAFALSSIASMLGTFIFLFLGGLQFLDSSLDAKLPLTNQPISIAGSGPYFTHFLSFELFPQRAFLFGMIILLTCGTLLLSHTDRTRSQKIILLCLIALPLLVFTHIHSFIAAAVFLFSLFIFGHPDFNRKSIFKFSFVTALLSLPLIYFLLFKNPVPANFQFSWSKIRLGFGPTDLNELYFWIYETGVFIPLAILGFYQNHINLKIRALFVAGFILFIMGITTQLQPNPYDNLKIFTYAFLFLTPFVALAIESFFTHRKKIILIPIAIVLMTSLCYSGLHDFLFLSGKNQSTLFFSKEDFELAEEWKNLHASADTVLIVPKHNHWVPCLTGSPVWMGYPGWLWSWGIQYRDREIELNQIFAGTPISTELILKNRLKYAIFSDQELVERQPINLAFFQNHYKMIFHKGHWFGFDLKH